MLTGADVARLVDLASRTAAQRGIAVADAIDRLEDFASSDDPEQRKAAPLVGFVEKIRRIRLRRNELVGAPLFRDPAWDMLLDLFCAHERGDRVSVSALCGSAGVPPSTALRQLVRLEAHGMVERAGDSTDLRRSWVHATPKALASIGTVAGLLAEALV